MINACQHKSWGATSAQNIIRGFLVAAVALAVSGPASAQTKKDRISFNLVPNPKFEDCLRVNNYEPLRAHVTVYRGELNDILTLDLDGIKPGLAFDLFTVQRSPFTADGSPDPKFGTFGLAWYQSDIQIDKKRDSGHVRIRTILLDQIFGFDPDVSLAPTNTFHVGFWFNNPEDAVACGFDPTKPTPFNGEHRAGPLAMISLPDANTGLGPLCTDPNDTTTPATCNP
jgi:hypothetical protein